MTSTGAARPIASFVDDLSNWYVRRSRRRFWKSGDDTDKQSAYATLYECLVTLSKLLAPFMPFMADAMYRNLVGSVDQAAPESVHLAAWPQAPQGRVDEQLVSDTRLVMKLVSLGHAARNSARVKVRQPLGKVAVHVKTDEEAAAIERLREPLLDELNVKVIRTAAGCDGCGRGEPQPVPAAARQKVWEPVSLRCAPLSPSSTRHSSRASFRRAGRSRWT